MNRSIFYNNAAVYLTELGHHNVAFDLFVCALECRFEPYGKVEWAEAVLSKLFQYEAQDPYNHQSFPDPCCPFLYRSPFEIRETEYMDECYATAILLFNTGLAHQRLNRGSRKAAEFYQASSQLLLESIVPDSNCLGLRVSLLNNFGVYCYEAGLNDFMRVCFDEVEDAIEKEDISTIKLSLIEGVQENLENFIHPSCGASPAA